MTDNTARVALKPEDIFKARDILSRLCRERTLLMSIPVRDEDEDMVLLRVIKAAEAWNTRASAPADHIAEPSKLVGKVRSVLVCVIADLEGIMPDVDPSGDRTHSGWRTLKECQELLSAIHHVEDLLVMVPQVDAGMVERAATAMQDIWNDYVNDTDCYPTDFINKQRNLIFLNFLSAFGDRLAKAAITAIDPAAIRRQALEEAMNTCRAIADKHLDEAEKCTTENDWDYWDTRSGGAMDGCFGIYELLKSGKLMDGEG